MKERPILFSGAMARAILDGSKTQTRRVVKKDGGLLNYGAAQFVKDGLWYPTSPSGKAGLVPPIICPYGQPGDRLWVREQYKISEWMPSYATIEYTANDHKKTFVRQYLQGRITEPVSVNNLRPSIFMPRWASRITLEITGVRVERLHDISEKDAISEGVTYTGPFPMAVLSGFLPAPDDLAIKEFKILWESINGAESWYANPWVWVIEFKRVQS